MRGVPVLRLLIVFLGLAAVAVPLILLTSGQAKQAEREAPRTTARVVRADVNCRFAHKPRFINLSVGDKTLVRIDQPENSPVSREIHLAPEEGLELKLEATWPEGTPETALTVEIVPDEFDARAETRWGEGTLSEILSFVWK